MTNKYIYYYEKDNISFSIYRNDFFIGCNSTNSISLDKSPEELKLELKKLEEMSPVTYITAQNVTLTPKNKTVRNAGLFRKAEYAPDGAVIDGDFTNIATIAKFKDIEVKVSFYSQTQTLIEEKSYVIYQYINPNSIIHFSMKIDALPAAYKEFSFKVIGASQVE